MNKARVGIPQTKKQEPGKRGLTWQKEPFAGAGVQPLLTVRVFVRLADKFKLTGYLSIMNCEGLYLQLHVFHILKTELGTIKGPVRTSTFSATSPHNPTGQFLSWEENEGPSL
jgi:hypothetical protein